MNQSHVSYQESHCLWSLSQPPDLSSFGFDFNVAARWRLHRSGYMLVLVLLGARSAPGSLSLRVRRVRLQLISASIGVRVVLWQRRRVLPSQGGVWRNQTLLHPLLLLHPSVLEPNFDLKVEIFLLRIIPSGSRQFKTYLGLVQLERCCNLNPPGSGEIFVEVKFFLQFCQLFGGEVRPPRVVDSSPLPTVEAVRFRSWNTKTFSCCIRGGESRENHEKTNKTWELRANWSFASDKFD